MSTIQSILANPAYHDILALIKGLRNGVVYGVKVRFPHALIMSILFQSGSWQRRAQFIFKATKQHATNLAKFVGTYKLALLLQKYLNQGKERKADTFFAGLVGGWLVFGERNAVNEQIVLYVVSRVITSFLPRALPPQPPVPYAGAPGAPLPPGAPYPKPRPPNSKVFKVYAALTWGAVMYLFKERRDTLQGGMVNSMQYLYLDSEVWTNLRTFIWHNK